MYGLQIPVHKMVLIFMYVSTLSAHLSLACPVGAGGGDTLICHNFYTVVPCWPRSCYFSSSDYS